MLIATSIPNTPVAACRPDDRRLVADECLESAPAGNQKGPGPESSTMESGTHKTYTTEGSTRSRSSPGEVFCAGDKSLESEFPEGSR